MVEISWSIAVSGAFLIIALVFLLLFRPQVAALIDRAKSFSAKGFSGEFAEGAKAQQQQQAEVAPVDDLKSLPEVLDLAAVYVQARERALETRLQELSLNPQQEKRVLLRWLAVSLENLSFEIVDNVIFGSQLRLLQALNSHPISLENIKKGYLSESREGITSHKEIDFPVWLEFLTNMELVKVNGEKAEITAKGKGFLVHLLQMGRNVEPRPN